jgi:hypothetical protein
VRASTLSTPAVSWLNRNVVGMTVTSFLQVIRNTATDHYPVIADLEVSL